ncbi:prepilin peptidase [Sphingomonas hengshuiensis]|uniref:Prepilin leader peptidase/N-methyltransferase n=1 Tax=Sphingomonas hengshuiensis TaxID=1609977 RepID=A0A7U4J736_9SPHN|nr:A24 family peptidase [Sphingomonas hengshuiensis]AJP71456.1 peptidase A24 [Sphingomonas hengshuiensis]
MRDAAIWAGLLGGLGLVFGSFIATLAIRWPAGRSIATGRSACDGCGTPLRAHQLVPVLSFLLQRGRCAACGATIARSHLKVELIAGGAGALAGFVAPGLEGAFGAVFGWLLLTLAALDLAAFWLPNRVTATLAVVGLAEGALGDWGPTLDDRLIGGAVGYGVLWLVAALYRRVRGRQGLGGGDAKMLGAIGLWLGWHALPLAVLVACAIGLVAVAAMTLAGRGPDARTRLPFGAMLAVAAWGCWLAAASPLYLLAGLG